MGPTIGDPSSGVSSTSVGQHIVELDLPTFRLHLRPVGVLGAEAERKRLEDAKVEAARRAAGLGRI